MDFILPVTGWVNLPAYNGVTPSGDTDHSVEYILDPSLLESQISTTPVVSNLAGSIAQCMSRVGWKSTGYGEPFSSPATLRPLVSEAIEVPDAIQYREDIKASMPYALFRKRVERGDVILNRRRAINVSCTPFLTKGKSTLLERSALQVGINAYEVPTRAPGKYTWQWFNGQGVIPFSPFTNSSTPVTTQSRVYGAKWFEKYQGTPGHSFIEGTPNLKGFVQFLDDLPRPPNLKTYALDEAYSGIYDGLTELGELPETVKYIYETLRRILMLFVSMRRKATELEKKFSGKDLVDEISSLWMQFRYAASPLAYSVEDALKLMDTKPLSYVTVRKREDVPFRYESGSTVITGTMEHRCFVKCKLKMSAYQNIGFSPVKTLWELTPLTFVVDWVLPIGSLLGTIVPPHRVDEVHVLESKRVRLASCNNGHMDVDYYVAEPSNAVPNGLTFDVTLSTKRILDALALSWGLFLKQYWKS